MFTVGVLSLFWGPLRTWFGRRIAYFAACAAFVAVTVVCSCPQHHGIGHLSCPARCSGWQPDCSVGQGAIADVFPPEVRGMAFGIFMVPLLVGPILGPLIGGEADQQALGGAYICCFSHSRWSCFYLDSGMG